MRVLVVGGVGVMVLGLGGVGVRVFCLCGLGEGQVSVGVCNNV